MCVLCDLGLKAPADHYIQLESGNGPLSAGKPSLGWDAAGDQIASHGWANAGATPITYAFRSSNAADVGFERFDANLIAQTEAVFDLWADIANITFERVGSGDTGEGAYSNNATILLSGDTNSGGYGWAYFPGSTDSSSLAGDVFLNTSGNNFDDVSLGSYEFLALTHEIGHSIGLDHPGAYNGGSPTYANDAEYAEDSRQYTVMSYFDAEETGAVHGWNFAATPLLHDIAAAQSLYGANFSTRADDTVYGFNATADRASYVISSATEQVVFAIWDGGGVDMLDFSGYRDDQLIDLREESFSDVGGLTGNVAVARGAVIENAASGAGDDDIFGNSSDNVLWGNSGKDTLSGRGGADTLNGGSSNDYLFGGTGNDTINGGAHKDWLYGGGGNDVINGGSGDDYIYGEGGDDIIDGSSGNDRITGKHGNDIVNGGSGDDIIYAGAGNDEIIGGSGFDTLDFSAVFLPNSVMVELQAHVATSNVSGTDSVWGIERVKGTASDDWFKGDKRDNEFLGLDGDDWFRGLEGADVFKGGAGNDTYYWAEKDVVRDDVHMGVDTIRDYSVTQDILDLSDIATEAADINLVETAIGTMVQVNVGGDYADVVMLADKFGIDADKMVDDGYFLV